MADYLVQEADGTSRFTLEDGTGSILLEAGVSPVVVAPGGSHVFAVAPRPLRAPSSGRLRARAARIRVLPQPATLTVSYQLRSAAPFRVRAAAPQPEFAFHFEPSEQAAGFWKRRTRILEERIRRMIIEDE